jgi:CheY-specific phosphatase CheX
MSPIDLLLAKYDLEPAPESVKRLGTLVADRAAESRQIAQIIATDASLTQRLLDGDVPAMGLTDEIEAQIFRLGIEPVLVLAMSDPLLIAVRRTFETMMGFTLETAEVGDFDGSEAPGFISHLSFSGRANGHVYLRLEPEFGRRITSQVLGISESVLITRDIIDVLAELSNMIVGNFKSNLCDAGLSCRLSIPEVTVNHLFAPPKVSRGRHRVFGLRFEGMPLLVDILVEFAS